MSVKRRNNGRNKINKGHSDSVHCTNCYRLVIKDKAIKRFVIKKHGRCFVQKRYRSQLSLYRKWRKIRIPKFYVKNERCVACAIHGLLESDQVKTEEIDMFQSIDLTKEKKLLLVCIGLLMSDKALLIKNLRRLLKNKNKSL